MMLGSQNRQQFMGAWARSHVFPNLLKAPPVCWRNRGVRSRREQCAGRSSLGRRSRPTNCPFKRTSFTESPRVALPDTRAVGRRRRLRPARTQFTATTGSTYRGHKLFAVGRRRRRNCRQSSMVHCSGQVSGTISQRLLNAGLMTVTIAPVRDHRRLTRLVASTR